MTFEISSRRPLEHIKSLFLSPQQQTTLTIPSSIPISGVEKHQFGKDDLIVNIPSQTSSSGYIYSMCKSNHNDMICCVNTCGSIHIWSTIDWTLLYEYTFKTLLDANYITRVIEEYYVCKFAPDDQSICVGGKRKNRYEWDILDDDNKILECPLTIINLLTDQVQYLYGHTEEVLCLESVFFKNQFYYVTGSFDGSIIKWLMDKNCYTNCLDKIAITDNCTNVVLDLSFVFIENNCYMIGACDNMIKLYDFERNQLIQTFPTDYQVYCSSLQVLISNQQLFSKNFNKWNGLQNESSTTTLNNQQHIYILTKGVNPDDYTDPSCIHLRKLTFTSQKTFSLETEHVFEHGDYMCNLWMIKCKIFLGHLFAPSRNGKLFIWNLESKQLIAILNDHSENVRNVLVFSSVDGLSQVMATCGDDSITHIYQSVNQLTTTTRNDEEVTIHNTSKEQESTSEDVPIKGNKRRICRRKPQIEEKEEEEYFMDTAEIEEEEELMLDEEEDEEDESGDEAYEEDNDDDEEEEDEDYLE